LGVRGGDREERNHYKTLKIVIRITFLVLIFDHQKNPKIKISKGPIQSHQKFGKRLRKI
jgi:hypothetical protein